MANIFTIPITSRPSVEALLAILCGRVKRENIGEHLPGLSFTNVVELRWEVIRSVETGRIAETIIVNYHHIDLGAIDNLMIQELAEHNSGLYTGEAYDLSGLYSVERVLALTARESRINGYAGAKAVIGGAGIVATKDSVIALLAELPINSTARAVVAESLTEGDQTQAVAATNWAINQDYGTEWGMKIRALANSGTCKRSELGIAVSIFGGYLRDLKERRLAEALAGRKSNHIGIVGEMTNLLNVTVVEVETRYDEIWGESTLVRFVSAEGDILFTYYGGSEKFAEGEVTNIRFKVKEHTGFGANDQTKITHVKRIDEKGKIVRAGAKAKADADDGFVPGEINAETWGGYTGGDMPF